MESVAARDDHTAFLGLGANLGCREGQIRWALDRLEAVGAICVDRVSSFYETEAVDWDDGPLFLNAVAIGRTRLSPLELLRIVKRTEEEAGRKPSLRNAPRPLDIDLLLYDRETIRTPELEVPHPRMRERAFVLWPLAEIAPDVEIAPGLTARQAKEALGDREAIRWWGAFGGGR